MFLNINKINFSVRKHDKIQKATKSIFMKFPELYVENLSLGFKILNFNLNSFYMYNYISKF